jgi:general secretion pathway protein C
MGQYLSWLANAALLGFSCFLVANTANTVFAAILTPAPEEVAPATPPPPLADRSWGDRRVILDRNLFDSAVVAPPQKAVAPEPEPENLEATNLPLELLGTICSNDPAESVAVVQDAKERETLVLRVHDSIQGNAARVTRIECKRIVLREGGKLRELALEEDAPKRPTATRTASSRTSSRKATKRSSRRARRSGPTNDRAPSGAMRAAAKLFSEAQILPKYDAGEMIGVQINAIQPDSTFERLGFAEGDVITKLNDIEIDSPEQSARVLAEFSEATEFTVELDDGTVRTMTLDPEGE